MIEVASPDGQNIKTYTINIYRVPSAPSIFAWSQEVGALEVRWNEPNSSGGTDITSYDVRYIETAKDGTVDANWTVLRNAWSGGALTYTITGLLGGVRYDVQVRAVNAAGGVGNWSGKITAIPPSRN